MKTGSFWRDEEWDPEDVDDPLFHARRRFSWVDDRWHLDRRPIRNGAAMLMTTTELGVINGRVESRNGGRRLYFHFFLNRVPSWDDDHRPEPADEVSVQVTGDPDDPRSGPRSLANRLHWPS